MEENQNTLRTDILRDMGGSRMITETGMTGGLTATFLTSYSDTNAGNATDLCHSPTITLRGPYSCRPIG